MKLSRPQQNIVNALIDGKVGSFVDSSKKVRKATVDALMSRNIIYAGKLNRNYLNRRFYLNTGYCLEIGV